MKLRRKHEWLSRLPEVHYDETAEDLAGEPEGMSLADALLTLVEINHEREYAICREVAKHLLGTDPEQRGEREE